MMDEYNQKISGNPYRDMGSQGVGQNYAGGAVPTQAPERESLTLKLDRLEKEFYEYRQANEQRIDKLGALLTQLMNYVGMR